MKPSLTPVLPSALPQPKYPLPDMALEGGFSQISFKDGLNGTAGSPEQPIGAITPASAIAPYYKHYPGGLDAARREAERYAARFQKSPYSDFMERLPDYESLDRPVPVYVGRGSEEHPGNTAFFQSGRDGWVNIPPVGFDGKLRQHAQTLNGLRFGDALERPAALQHELNHAWIEGEAPLGSADVRVDPRLNPTEGADRYLHLPVENRQAMAAMQQDYTGMHGDQRIGTPERAHEVFAQLGLTRGTDPRGEEATAFRSRFSPEGVRLINTMADQRAAWEARRKQLQAPEEQQRLDSSYDAYLDRQARRLPLYLNNQRPVFRPLS